MVINDGDEFDALCQAQKDGRLPPQTHIEYADEQKTLRFLTHLIWKRRLIKR